LVVVEELTKSKFDDTRHAAGGGIMMQSRINDAKQVKSSAKRFLGCWNQRFYSLTGVGVCQFVFAGYKLATGTF
jgi:hypothetical protein